MDIETMRERIDREDLLNSYDSVYQKFVTGGNLNLSELQSSRDLFEKTSLNNGRPRPERLEVIAVLAGLEFSASFQAKLRNIQTAISSILCDTLAYWVLPKNFALEFFVLKWPEDEFEDEQIIIGEDCLNNLQQQEFKVYFNGFQIHRDGCVVARGIDTEAEVRNWRTKLINKKIISSRQSNWAHVPLGRILEPFDNNKYQKLIELINQSQDEIFHCEVIDRLSLVHETRWYMEEKSILCTLKLPRIKH